MAHRDIYALLIKPSPNNPNMMGERREIALMEQLMKVVLRAVRATTYSRLEGRVLAPQLGWLQGCSTAHVGVQLLVLVQQAARLGHTLNVCYVDLATFFPSIDRGVLLEHMSCSPACRATCLTCGHLWRGGGGGGRGRRRAVSLRQRGGALRGAFENNMGALMGCVLSPSRAKLFVNSIIAAIHLAVCVACGCGAERRRRKGRGVEAPGFVRLRRRLGRRVHRPVEELKLAWQLFSSWSVVMGQRLGIKKALKTVVTGVRYEGGRPRAVDDPGLRLPDGTAVPFVRHEVLYKHLGLPVRADAADGAVFKLVRGKVVYAMQNMRRMRGASQREFCKVADVLVRGVVGFYFQLVYLTWAEAEKLEAIFRGRRSTDSLAGRRHRRGCRCMRSGQAAGGGARTAGRRRWQHCTRW